MGDRSPANGVTRERCHPRTVSPENGVTRERCHSKTVRRRWTDWSRPIAIMSAKMAEPP
jgi:hypothetical protein